MNKYSHLLTYPYLVLRRTYMYIGHKPTIYHHACLKEARPIAEKAIADSEKSKKSGYDTKKDAQEGEVVG